MNAYRDNWLWEPWLKEIRRRRDLARQTRDHKKTYTNVYGGNQRKNRDSILNNPKRKKPDTSVVTRVIEPLHGTIVKALTNGGRLIQNHHNSMYFVLIDAYGNLLGGRGGGFPNLTVKHWCKRGLLIQRGYEYVLPTVARESAPSSAPAEAPAPPKRTSGTRSNRPQARSATH